MKRGGAGGMAPSSRLERVPVGPAENSPPPGLIHKERKVAITNYNRKINLALRRVAVLVEKGETEKALRALGFLALRIERGVFVGYAKGYHVKEETK